MDKGQVKRGNRGVLESWRSFDISYRVEKLTFDLDLSSFTFLLFVVTRVLWARFRWRICVFGFWSR